MGKFGLSKMACIVFVYCAMMVIVSPAQTFTTLANFNGTNGDDSTAPLIQASDGNFYGTTSDGGANGGGGTVFKVTPAGTLTALYSFCAQAMCADGSAPMAGLVQGSDGNFYGTTSEGGTGICLPRHCGTVFQITPAGMLTTLHSFGGNDGSHPLAGLVQGSDGNFYGTTQSGGDNSFGTVFTITSAGAFTTLYSFQDSDGSFPQAGLVQGSDGNFYGTTASGGDNESGTVFAITPAGTLTTLYSFCSQPNCADGSFPQAGVVQGSDGNLYGTTSEGGAYGFGTAFELTLGGTLTTLYSFCGQTGCTDGATPAAGLVQATDGNFYGTTIAGGANQTCSGGTGCGTIFRITTAGALTTLYSFCSLANCADGELPNGLVQGTNGTFYGTTSAGGPADVTVAVARSSVWQWGNQARCNSFR